MEPTGRRVRAVVVHEGTLLGALPGFDVAGPSWSDVEPVAAELDRRLGARTAVLRMVTATGRMMRGGEVTYLVEAMTPPTSAPRWDGTADPGVLAPHEHRMPWAEPGGPARVLDWATAELRGVGRPLTGPPVQVKSWNLSCLYRLPATAGPVWLKCTPPFLGAEALAAGYVAEHDPDLAPAVLAATADGGCTVMADVPGRDCWDADAATVAAVLPRYVAVQAALAGHALPGLPDRRVSTLAARADRLLAPDVTADLDAAERRALARLVAGLADRGASIAGTGVPETLVHGDFHPGNWRSDGRRRVVFDWCESRRGHPACDVLRLAEWLPAPLAALAAHRWAAEWRAAVPGCDPDRAAELVRPVQHLEAALTYQTFLDGIEPDERVYHEGDPVEQIRLALAHRAA
ncbi:aminoglycoside phosphotransferase family protein [Pseudonocardia adelaidensis]|uniref:aminoglycoside phosphotransferase family protein n=1 Tax=Pseudonocardia adelaidensis TaxID=648754 RepID=UPI0031E547D7